MREMICVLRWSVLLISLASWGVALAANSISMGVYSGSFDPPTRAHFALIRDSINRFHLEKIYVLVNQDGVKSYKTSVEERIEMLRQELQDLGARVEVVPILQKDKGEFLRKHAPIGAELYQFIGEDSFRLLPDHLRRPVEDQHWVVYERGQESKAAFRDGAQWIDLPEISGVSSSQVRLEIKEGRASPDLLPSVAGYIRLHGLYGTLPDCSGLLMKQE